MIVRWDLTALPGVLDELGVSRPLLVASERWSHLELPAAGRWRVVPTDELDAVVACCHECDGLLAVGGGSAIDVAKAVSARTGLRVVALPTTYSGAECTEAYGIKDSARRVKGGGYDGRVAAIVYDVGLTLDLPRAETSGTALNALAHCAEALYATARNPVGDDHALEGARLIGEMLPHVLSHPRDAERRRGLLMGAMHGGLALASAGLGLAHAMAQTIGGRYGLSHGAMNALCLPPVLRFNAPNAREQIARFDRALGAADAAVWCEEIARRAGHLRLRDAGVPEGDLPSLAELTATRPGALSNPRDASTGEILELLRGIW